LSDPCLFLQFVTRLRSNNGVKRRENCASVGTIPLAGNAVAPEIVKRQKQKRAQKEPLR